MVLVIGVLAAAFLVVLVFALATGRVRLRQQSCCAPGDPNHDLRMRAGLREDSGQGSASP